ncbi:MAG TPA: hypothetical protein VFW17_13660 [Ktedonobacterales bacterium]|nr:hypothetical protein [Ktedonobacterales bacterium]
MPDEWYGVLQREFSAEEGSFLLQLRTEMIWDKAAFTRLTTAMLECCKAYDRTFRPPETLPLSETQLETLLADYYQQSVPRWLAEGFWYLSDFPKGHTSHPAWHDTIAREPEYYDKAYWRLFILADWFFTGQGPLDPDKRFAPM